MGSNIIWSLISAGKPQVAKKHQATGGKLIS